MLAQVQRQSTSGHLHVRRRVVLEMVFPIEGEAQVADVELLRRDRLGHAQPRLHLRRWWQVCSTRRQNSQIRSRCKPPKKGRPSSHKAAVPFANCGSRRFTNQMYLSMYAWATGFSPGG